MSENKDNKDLLTQDNQKTLLDAGLNPNDFTESKYWTWADGIRNPVFELEPSARVIEDNRALIQIADLATAMLPFGNINIDKYIKISDIKVNWDNKVYLLDTSIQVPKKLLASPNILNPNIGDFKEMAPDNLSMQVVLRAITGEILTPETDIDIPTLMYLNNDGTGLRLYATNISHDKIHGWTDQQVGNYVQTITESLSAKGSN